MINRFLYPLAQKEDVEIPTAKAVYVVFSRLELRELLPLLLGGELLMLALA